MKPEEEFIHHLYTIQIDGAPPAHDLTGQWAILTLTPGRPMLLLKPLGDDTTRVKRTSLVRSFDINTETQAITVLTENSIYTLTASPLDKKED